MDPCAPVHVDMHCAASDRLAFPSRFQDLVSVANPQYHQIVLTLHCGLFYCTILKIPSQHLQYVLRRALRSLEGDIFILLGFLHCVLYEPPTPLKCTSRTLSASP